MRSDPIAVAPRRTPVAGHLPSLARGPLRFIESLARYGPIVTIYLGTRPAYVVTSPDLIRDLLVTKVDSFGKGVQYEKLAGLLGDSLSTSVGREHRDRRREMQPAFHRQQVAKHTAVIRECTEELVGDWRPGQVIATDVAMRWLTLTVLTRTLCGANPTPDLVRSIQEDLPLVLRGVGRRVLLPVLERLPLPSNRDFDAAVDRLRREIGGVIERSAGTELVTDRRDDLVNLLAAGAETTGNALAWLWHAVSTEPEVAARLHEEAATGATEYTDRVIRETLRLYPAAWIISRQTTEPVELGGRRLPAGAQVLFSPYAVHRSAAEYPDPTAFDPDRWLPDRVQPSRAAYFPFGAGPHNCIGEHLAMLELTTVVTTIASRYRLRSTGPVRPRARATLTPSPLRLRIERAPG